VNVGISALQLILAMTVPADLGLTRLERQSPRSRQHTWVPDSAREPRHAVSCWRCGSRRHPPRHGPPPYPAHDLAWTPHPTLPQNYPIHATCTLRHSRNAEPGPAGAHVTGLCLWEQTRFPSVPGRARDRWQAALAPPDIYAPRADGRRWRSLRRHALQRSSRGRAD